MNLQDLVADASGRVECCSVQGTPRRSGGGVHIIKRQDWAGYKNSILGRQHAQLPSLFSLEVARLRGCASRNTRDITGMVKEQGRGRRASLVKASRFLIFRSQSIDCWQFAGDLPMVAAGCAACELVRSSCRAAFARKARAMTAPDVLAPWLVSNDRPK